MPKCNRCGQDVFIASRDGYCGDCEGIVRKQEREQRLQGIILTTSVDVPNRDIENILGIVASEAAIGQNFLKDIGNSIRDIVGGRSGNVQNTLKQARNSCLAELRQEALELGADAVIAVDLDYNEASTGSGGGILFVTASGTAVKLKS
ncbi:YbjQ family protein [Rhizobium sp. CB3171]|uniref:YbjQ family protein n=1 Tax=unclassified Rhizobium TaxID=2613769 RepID=UPI001FE0A369|nr:MULTISPECIES: YbjQ family protein [Rhizobium]MDK4739848.1 YbjQ family protein [Rhizobium sp. CNPSo 3464]UWU20521.1 YbjQ family protein [Rhizobium tropici]WFU01321.1 YbjQ family protein [Rhizobium sp. CB3171]